MRTRLGPEGLRERLQPWLRRWLFRSSVPRPFLAFLLVYEATLPDTLTDETGATRVLVLGALSLMLGLALSALNRPVLRLLEGYPLVRAGGKWAARLNDALTGRFRKRFDALEAQLDDPAVRDPTRAALELQEEFPAARDSILPTAFGNVMRSFETHPRRRYGLDGIAIWPRMELLLSKQELDTLGEAQANVNFFVNILVVSILVGVGTAVDWAWHASGVLAGIAHVVGVMLAAAAIAVGSYRGALQAAKVWGDGVRAAFDVHRLDLYSKLGVRPPRSPADELKVAEAVNRCILFGEPIAMEFRSRPEKR